MLDVHERECLLQELWTTRQFIDSLIRNVQKGIDDPGLAWSQDLSFHLRSVRDTHGYEMDHRMSRREPKSPAPVDAAVPRLLGSQ